jgi:hypothetical protein
MATISLLPDLDRSATLHLPCPHFNLRGHKMAKMVRRKASFWTAWNLGTRDNKTKETRTKKKLFFSAVCEKNKQKPERKWAKSFSRKTQSLKHLLRWRSLRSTSAHEKWISCRKTPSNTNKLDPICVWGCHTSEDVVRHEIHFFCV